LKEKFRGRKYILNFYTFDAVSIDVWNMNSRF